MRRKWLSFMIFLFISDYNHVHVFLFYNLFQISSSTMLVSSVTDPLPAQVTKIGVRNYAWQFLL